MSQIVAVNQTILRTLPPGIFPPLVVQYDASSVPILQLGLSSDTLTEQELYDYGQNFIRTRLSTVPGISVPLPYGGKVRSVMVDLNPAALFGKGLSATDVSNALSLQNLILPTGTVKVGTREYLIQLNSSPELVSALNDVPIKTVNGAPVYMRDVAQVRDGYQVQTNIVRSDGKRSALLTVLRHGGASTLAVVDGVKKLMPAVEATVPPALRITPLFDQSLFVRASVSGVVREATIAAILTGLMILLFLGSWRSTLIVCLSIPLSILTSLIVLSFLGETINVMTLGGLALAVGILVDDATVEIENVHRNMGMNGKTLVRAILDGAQQIAVPAFVSTLCICIVFVPVLMLSGAAKYLFTPLSMAVVFAMLTSYLLTRTVVPTLVHYLLPVEIPLYQEGEEAATAARAAGPIWRIHQAFDRQFEKLRDAYHRPAGAGAGTSAAGREAPLPHSHFRRWAWCCWWDRTSFPMWIPARCGCTCGVLRGLALKRPNGSSARSRRKSAVLFRQRNWTPFWTISACRIRASISPSAIAPPMDRATERFSFRSNPNTTRRSAIRGNSVPSLPPDSPRRSSSSRPRTSPARS